MLRRQGDIGRFCWDFMTLRKALAVPGRRNPSNCVVGTISSSLCPAAKKPSADVAQPGTGHTSHAWRLFSDLPVQCRRKCCATYIGGSLHAAMSSTLAGERLYSSPRFCCRLLRYQQMRSNKSDMRTGHRAADQDMPLGAEDHVEDKPWLDARARRCRACARDRACRTRVGGPRADQCCCVGVQWGRRFSEHPELAFPRFPVRPGRVPDAFGESFPAAAAFGRHQSHRHVGRVATSGCPGRRFTRGSKISGHD